MRSMKGRHRIMAKKKKNSRKALAVALGIMGIAGLSVASASTLEVTAGNEVAIGTDTFAACDTDGVDVNYTYYNNGGTYEIDSIYVTAIDTSCNAKGIQFTLEDAAGAPVASGSGTVTAGAFSYDATGDSIPVATDLGDVTVIIG